MDYGDFIKKTQRKIAEILQKRQKLLDTVVAENRGYTDAELKQSQEMAEEIRQLEIQLKEAQELEKKQAGIPSGQPAPSVQQGEPVGTRMLYRTLGHFVRDIHQGGNSQEFRDYRVMIEPQIRAMNITDGGSLGYLMPDQFEAGTLQLIGAGNHIRQRATVIPAGEFPDQKFMKRVMVQGSKGVYNGIIFNYTGEGKKDNKERSKIVYEIFTLDPSNNKIIAIYITTEESLQNPTSVNADMERGFRGGYAAQEEDLFINGDGVGKPKGILYSKALKKVKRNTTGKISFEDILLMKKHTYKASTNYIWEITEDLYVEIGALTDKGGRYIMIPGDATKGIPPILHSHPIYWNPYTPTAGNTGDIILADWSFYYIKEGSGPFFKTDDGKGDGFEDGTIKVAMTVKVDADTWIREPLKQKNGLEVSPFVALEG